MGIRVGDHLEGPAAAKRGLCCREGLGHPQLKAPIPEEAGCVELCHCGTGWLSYTAWDQVATPAHGDWVWIVSSQGFCLKEKDCF